MTDQFTHTPLQFGLSEQIIATLCRVFAQYAAIDTVLVYGSRANGTFRPYSDIDLAVDAPPMTEREFSRLWTALDDLPILFKLDVVHVEQLSNAALKQKILDEGAVLYSAH